MTTHFHSEAQPASLAAKLAIEVDLALPYGAAAEGWDVTIVDGALVIVSGARRAYEAPAAADLVLNAVATLATIVCSVNNDGIAKRRPMSGLDLYILGRGYFSEEGCNVGTFGSTTQRALTVKCDGLSADGFRTLHVNGALTFRNDALTFRGEKV